jgi:CubicO group peptidase (beta-lactamase class C family)
LFDPGTKWNYSPGPAVLADIIQKLSGQSLEEWDQERIFRPLGMVDTSYAPAPEKAARLATIHQLEKTGLVETPNPARYTPDVRGDGGLVSTASDYSAFVQMFLNEGSQLPPGVKWAAVTAVESAPDGTIYVIHRCFANSCADRKEPPILKFDANGKLLKSWGEGLFIFPRDRRSRRQSLGDRRRRGRGQRPPGDQVQPRWQADDDARQGGRQRVRPRSF